MAATALTIVDMPLFGNIAALSFAAVDSVNGNSIPGDGLTMLVLRGTGAGGKIATMVSVADGNNRTGDIVTAAIATDEIMILYPARTNLFRKKTGVDKGVILFTFDGADIEVIAVRLAQ